MLHLFVIAGGIVVSVLSLFPVLYRVATLKKTRAGKAMAAITILPRMRQVPWLEQLSLRSTVTP